MDSCAGPWLESASSDPKKSGRIPKLDDGFMMRGIRRWQIQTYGDEMMSFPQADDLPHTR
jgi:hypothetical protein